MAPPLHVCLPQASVPHPDRRGLKQWLIRGLWLAQARGREGYGMRDKPAVAEAGVTLQQPELCCVSSPGSCPWITGPWQWRAAQVPGRGCVDSDLCLQHRFLGGGSSSLSVSCPSLRSALIAAARAHLWSSFRRRSESPLLAHPETLVSCLLGRSRLFPGLPPG